MGGREIGISGTFVHNCNMNGLPQCADVALKQARMVSYPACGLRDISRHIPGRLRTHPVNVNSQEGRPGRVWTHPLINVNSQEDRPGTSQDTSLQCE